jgi:hypothetical protein
MVPADQHALPVVVTPPLLSVRRHTLTGACAGVIAAFSGV